MPPACGARCGATISSSSTTATSCRPKSLNLRPPLDLPDETFAPKGTALSLAGATDIVGSATWYTLTAQTCQSLAAEQALMNHCRERDRFALAEGAWKCTFVPAGTVLRERLVGRVVMVTGPVQFLAHPCWPVELAPAPGGAVLYRLAPQPPDAIGWGIILDWADWEVIPTAVASPAKRFLVQGRKLSAEMGISLLPTGPRSPSSGMRPRAHGAPGSLFAF